MKVLQINSVCGFGSTGRITVDLHELLKSKGHESKIAYGRYTHPENINTIKIGNNFDCIMHVVYTRVFDKTGFLSKRATKNFVEKIEEYKPDIIHLHNIHGYYINIEILFNYLRWAEIPVVWTLHDCWPFTGHCTYFDYVNCEKWKSGCSKCPQKNEYPSSLIFDNSARNYINKKQLFTGLKNLTIVTPSKWLADSAKKSFLGCYEVKVINNGTDLKIFKPTKEELSKKIKTGDEFIVCGVLPKKQTQRKGTAYFEQLAEKLPENYKILLIGLKDKEQKKYSKKIQMLPWTENIQKLAEAYSVADVFVNTTLADSFSMVNLEALACGTPVITFNSGGSTESLDKDCGYIVKKNDIEALIKTIIKACENPFKRENCRKRAEMFDKNVMFKKYIDLYEEMLK